MRAVIASIGDVAATNPAGGVNPAGRAAFEAEEAPSRRGRCAGFRDSLTIGTYPSGSVFIACVIAQHFSRGAPTVEALCERFNMSRSTAYRWRRAWMDALGHAQRAGRRSGTEGAPESG